MNANLADRVNPRSIATAAFVGAGIWTLLIGFVVGLLAQMLMPGRDPTGSFITAAIGITESLLATFSGKALGMYSQGSRPSRAEVKRIHTHKHRRYA